LVGKQVKKGTREMIETIVKPTPLDNDIAVMKILQLLGQLSLNDMQYVLRVTLQVYGKVKEHDVEPTAG
jgi:hypothetical protein